MQIVINPNAKWAFALRGLPVIVETTAINKNILTANLVN